MLLARKYSICHKVDLLRFVSEEAVEMTTVEGEKKVEKEKCIPKDGQVMISILKDMGINDFEPRVVNQMLEFSYR